jgi:hypothetical protein
MLYSMSRQPLSLKRAASRSSGDDDYDVLAAGVVVGRIMKRASASEASLWFWSIAYGYHKDRSPTYGYAASRVAAMADFAKSWWRE